MKWVDFISGVVAAIFFAVFITMAYNMGTSINAADIQRDCKLMGKFAVEGSVYQCTPP
jgi:hypothetical protein